MPPPGTPACLTGGVDSNITITLVGGSTMDGAPFCVKPPPASSQSDGR
jgi:hypothetical protein